MSKWITKDKTYYQRLITLALPVAAQGLIAFLVTFADNLMVSTLGDNSVSGVYFAGQLSTFVQLFSGGIGGVILILSAQYWGQKNTTAIKRVVAIGLKLSCLVGILLTLICFSIPSQVMSLFTKDIHVIDEGTKYLRITSLSYIFFCISQALIFTMRSVEETKIGMKVSLISLFVNISLNALFIYVFHMGVVGAALGTVVARISEMLVVYHFVFKKDKKLGFKLADLKGFDKVLVKDYVHYGIPLVMGEVVWSINTMLQSVIFGQYFPPYVATAVSLANNMAALSYISIRGLASAVGIITGKTVGQGKYELMKEYARTTQVIFLFVGIVSGALVALLNKPFVSMFNNGLSSQAIDEAITIIYVLAITVVGTGYQMPCLFGLVKSGGDISFVFKNDTFFVCCVLLPSAFIAASLGAPAHVVYFCLKCDQILKSFVAVVKINRFKWMKNLTHT